MNLLVYLVWLLPLTGFVLTGVFGKKMPGKTAGFIATGVVLASFILSVILFATVADGQLVNAHLFTWFKIGTWQVDFGFLVDSLSVWMMLIITGIGTLIHAYSIGYMAEDEGFARFFSYLNLFIFSMLVLVMGDNYLMLFAGWEGVGLCSYLLIGFWYKNESFGYAARKAFIMNRIGDLGLLIGIFMILGFWGSAAYNIVLNPANSTGLSTEFVTVLCLLLFVGAIGKSAQIPLYTWLPDAMAGPTPVSALIHAATMVTAGIYLITRSQVLFVLSPMAMETVMWVGLATSIWAALIGLRQNDIKKVLAYSTVSQLGLMFLALGVGAFSAAMFHLTTHAFFKALLFLGSGSVIHALGGEQDIREMGGLRKKIPLTFATFFIGTLAIIGFPLFSGFFSKDEILAQVYAFGTSNGYGRWLWGFAGISALLTAIYMCRLLFVTFFGKFRGSETVEHHIHESPKIMTVPLVILALLSIAGGLLNLPHFLHLPDSVWLHGWLFGTESHTSSVLAASTEIKLMVFTTTFSLVVFGLAWWLYSKEKNLPVHDVSQQGLTKILAKKFYVDELYDWLFVKSVIGLSNIFYKIMDVKIIDGAVNAVGRGVGKIGAVVRRIQTGDIEFYLVSLVVGLILFLMVGIFF